MARRSRTRMDLRLALGFGGMRSGKKETTVSSMLSLPSACARPTAVDVKLLLKEYMVWRFAVLYGVHHPSPITEPPRTTITLCMPSTCASSASTYFSRSAELTPFCSGVERGSDFSAAASVEAGNPKLRMTATAAAKGNEIRTLFIG